MSIKKVAFPSTNPDGVWGVVTSWKSKSSLSESIENEVVFLIGGVEENEDCLEPVLEGGFDPHADVLVACENLFKSLGRDRFPDGNGFLGKLAGG